jgi:acetyltransferase-like isoleucine patch superfamily enzyme
MRAETRRWFRRTCKPALHAAWEAAGGRIGPYTYGRPEVLGLANAVARQRVFTIGSFCSIAEGVRLYLAHDHDVEAISTFPFTAMFRHLWPEAPRAGSDPIEEGSIHIGSDVWLGDQVSVMSGVKIGDGAVVAHRAVVTRDIGPYEIWGGVPARKIRDRFPPEVRDALLASRWWDLPLEQIRPLAPALLQRDPQVLLSALQRP